MEFAELIKTPKVDNVTLHRPLHKPTQVVLCITGHHLILSSRSSSSADELWILHVMVDHIERRQTSKQNSLIIKCKNFQVIQLDIKGHEELKDVADSIDWLSNLDDFRLMYPFYYCRNYEIIEDGWQMFDLEQEYRKILQSSNDWRISNANKGYALCSTYPEKFIVPKSVTDESLVKVAQFRSLGRFPVLSYLHKPNQAVIFRSSQPLVGPNKRCKDDERFLTSIIGDRRGHIIDTRHENVAQLSKTKGGGYELEIYYPLLRRSHRPTPRYNCLSDSLHKLVEACLDRDCSSEKWISALESSNWLGHVQSVLECACIVAQVVDQEGSSVLVHGSEGLDSTLQVCSLAQIILDPDCRTIQGFEALIVREWLHAGHPFSSRCRHSAFCPPNYDKREHSPVFLLFLDCVNQLTRQFACSFEFTEEFLILLMDHAHGSEFGTFLGACTRERESFAIPNHTTSLWSYINRPEILEKYLNPVYDPNDKVIWPSVAPQSLELWDTAFLRWTANMSFKEKAKKRLYFIRNEQRRLKIEGDLMRARLEEDGTVDTQACPRFSE